MIDNDVLNAEQIADRSMKIAADLCIYTNHNTVKEVLFFDQQQQDKQTEKVQLGYWPIRGKAMQIQYLLNYLNVAYDYETINFGETPETRKDQWSKVKDSLNLDFPNLPYLIDGEVKLTESKSIMKYLCSKHDKSLLGCDAVE